MTPPQPSSQTLRERAKRILGCLRELSANHGLKSQVCEDYVLHQLKAALAAQEASPQPDLGEEWSEQLSRVRMMSTDSGDTWDLSDNDQVALKALLALGEASPQPDHAREWFEKGYRAGVGQPYWDDFTTDDIEEAYLAACRQEPP